MDSNFMLGFCSGVAAALIFYCVWLAIQDFKVARHKKQMDRVHQDPSRVVHPHMVVSDKTLERTLNARNLIDPLMQTQFGKK
jgi:hypothetical protein